VDLPVESSRLEQVVVLHAQYYLEVIRQANALWQQGPAQSIEAVSLFETAWSNIALAHTRLLSAQHNPVIRDLIDRYGHFAADILQRNFSAEIQIQWFKAAVDAARQVSDSLRIGAHLNNLALAYAAAGFTDEVTSLYLERIRVAQAQGDLEGEAAGYCNLGTFFKDRGNTDEAILYI